MSHKPVFQGDDNLALHKVQSNASHSFVGHIVKRSIEKYLKAEKLLNVKTTLGDAVRENEHNHVYDFDDWKIKPVHDLIAAYYRYKTKYYPLFPDEFDEEDEKWKWFYYLEGVIESTFNRREILIRYCLITSFYRSTYDNLHMNDVLIAGDYMNFYFTHYFRDMYGSDAGSQKNIILESMTDYTNWKNHLLNCVECSWEGKYSQVGQNDCSSLLDFFCPTCKRHWEEDETEKFISVIPIVKWDSN